MTPCPPRALALIGALLLTCLSRAIAQTSTSGESPPAPDRAAVLSRGVNIPHWFAITQDTSESAIRTYFTGDDVTLLKSVGVTHVRLPVSPDFLFDRTGDRGDGSVGLIREAQLALYLNAVAMFTKEEIGVVVDPHVIDQKTYAPDPGTRHAADLERFWTALAPRLASTDPELVFLEIRNEPAGIKDGSLWSDAQRRIAQVMRAGAPKHTLILTGDEWGSIDGLGRLTPVKDANVIYSFHFYTPHNFTHQGATWGASFWKHLKDLPYPSSPEAVADAAAKIEDESARNIALAYGRERCDQAMIRSEIQRAAAWAKQHGVRLYCGEFGVYRRYAPARSREAWLKDVTAALGEHRIGWATWDYGGGFAITNGKPGQRELDRPTVSALGLTPR